MATLGLIGSGKIGGTLARLAVAAGLDVVVSNSRGPETLSGFVAELGPKARAATAAEAGAAGDWVVVSVPVKADALVPREPLVGKTVLDTGNYYPQRDGQIRELDSGKTTDSGLLQGYLEGAHVVKVFNNINFKHLGALGRPAGSSDRSALPIAGDDTGAKTRTAELLDLLGFDVVDAGPLAEGWRFQPGTPAYGLPYAGGTSGDLAASPGTPASAADIQAALTAAVRR